MLKKFALPICLITLSACGGSGGGPSVIPVSSAGFAEDGSRITSGDSFEVQGALRILGSTEGVLNFDAQDVKFSIDSSGNKVTVVIAGEPYILDVQDGGYYALENSDDIVEVTRLGDQYDEAEIVEVFSVVDDQLNTSSFVIGFDTDPAQVAAASGRAEMNGTIFVTARNGYNDGFGVGDATLNVDFENTSVSGDFTLINRDLNASDFAIPETSFAFEPAPITANGFSGDITLTDGDIGGDLADAFYSGRFYGENAPTAGGQISATVDVDGEDQLTFIEGAFIATR